MTLVIELNALSLSLLALALILIGYGISETFEWTTFSKRSRKIIPPSWALLLAFCNVLQLVSHAIRDAAGDNWWFLNLVPGAILLAAVILEARKANSQPHNKSLQQTLDPAAVSVDTEPSSASSAAEHRRYTAKMF